MAEWTIATVLKTVKPKGFEGSNPPPSATLREMGLFREKWNYLS